MEGEIDYNKRIYSTADFEQMGWHDIKIHAISFNADEYELLFDIDYIIEWIEPKQNGTNYQFLIAPATLVFNNVYDFNVNVDNLDFTIDYIIKENPRLPPNSAYLKGQVEYDWTIETINGQISFKSIGYIQYIRADFVLLDRQEIGLRERGGISFETVR